MSFFLNKEVEVKVSVEAKVSIKDIADLFGSMDSLEQVEVLNAIATEFDSYGEMDRLKQIFSMQKALTTYPNAKRWLKDLLEAEEEPDGG